MVQTKYQKQKMKKKQPSSSTGKKYGKAGDVAQLNSQLDVLGLKIVTVVADGNCFFRAVADQLEGNEENHFRYRDMVVDYIKDHQEEFEPFIEDDIPFDEYCDSMKQDGTWAGQMEIQALSLVCHINICIHRSMSPRWCIKNFQECDNRMIHLSYHNEEHYNSVRLKEDMGDGPAKLFVIEADANLSATSQEKVDPKKAKAVGNNRNSVNASSIKIVMGGSGCKDSNKVKQVLQEVNGDIDSAIEFLVAEGVAEYANLGDVTDDASCSASDTHDGVDANHAMDNYDEKPVGSNTGSSKLIKKAADSFSKEKAVSRNKDCPCGSKKKYKACCGAATGKSLIIEVHTNHKAVTNKIRKEQNRREKTEEKPRVPSRERSPPRPDLGALLI